jgi:GTPase SAR1 family protein
MTRANVVSASNEPFLKPNALKIVLFGMPDAGKTSMLGALAQAAQVQERILQAKLVDRGDGLAALRKQVYEERARETLEEIVPYPIVLELTGRPKLDAVLYDCDGRVANELLSKRKTLQEDARKNSLSHAVLSADALILVVDASAPQEQIDNDFREFVQFVRYLNSYRAEQHEVAGLPVFLVLSKCDLLVDHHATTQEWEAKIQERTRQVEERFQFFLGEQNTGFGSISLVVDHTAVKKPELKDAPGAEREPYGVAELFYAVFSAAEAFRTRTQLARKRLMLTLTLSGLFLLVGLSVAFWLIFIRTPEKSLQLSNKLEAFRAREGLTIQDRLNPSLLQDRLREITELGNDSEFNLLGEESRKFIQDRKKELEAYIQFRGLIEPYYPLGKLTSYTKLSEAEEALSKIAIIPEDYRSTWMGTEAVNLRGRILTEIPKLKSAFRQLEKYFEDLRTKGRQLLATSELNAKWEASWKSLFEEEKKLPFPDSDPDRGRVYQFDEIEQFQSDWQRTRDPLIQLRNLGLATGLLGDTSGTQPVLALVDLPMNSDVNRIAGERLETLKKLYPESKNWNLTRFSDTIRPQLEARLKILIDIAIREGQRLILAKLKLLNPTGESSNDWLKISEWLLSQEVQSYRELLLFLTRLYDPVGSDPVNLMVDFLRRTSFNIEMRELKLALPENVKEFKPTPLDPLQVYHLPQSETKPQLLTFTQLGDAIKDKEGRWVYTFSLKEGEPRFTFKPGDTAWATLKVRDGTKQMQLTWAKGHSIMYQFERFTRDPRLHEIDKASSTGSFAERVQLGVTKGFLPQIPALLPVVQ